MSQGWVIRVDFISSKTFQGHMKVLRRAAASSALNSGCKMFTAQDGAFRGRAAPHSAADALNTISFTEMELHHLPHYQQDWQWAGSLPSRGREAILSRVIEGLQGHGLQGHLCNSVTWCWPLCQSPRSFCVVSPLGDSSAHWSWEPPKGRAFSPPGQSPPLCS